MSRAKTIRFNFLALCATSTLGITILRGRDLFLQFGTSVGAGVSLIVLGLSMIFVAVVVRQTLAISAVRDRRDV